MTNAKNDQMAVIVLYHQGRPLYCPLYQFQPLRTPRPNLHKGCATLLIILLLIVVNLCVFVLHCHCIDKATFCFSPDHGNA